MNEESVQDLHEANPLEEAKQLEDLSKELRQKRVSFEKRWLVVDRFMDGRHFDTWNQEKNTFGTVKFVEGLNVRPIFLANKVCEGLLNNLLNSDPRWQVYTTNLTGNQEQDKIKKDYALKLQKYFSSLWDIGNLTTQVIEMVWNGFKYGFGVFEAYWDSANNRPNINTVLPYSILFDPTVKDIQDSSIVVKETSVPLHKIKNNELYSEYRHDIKDEGENMPSTFQKVRQLEKYF